MDSLIRSPELTSTRRPLRPSEALPQSETAVPDKDTMLAELRAELDRVRVESAAQLAETGTRLAAERAQMMAALESEKQALQARLNEDVSRMAQDAYNRAHAEGRAHGEEAGRLEWSQAVKKLGEAGRQLSAARQQLLEQAEDDMVEIAFAAVCRVLGRAEAQAGIVREAVRIAAANQWREHPAQVRIDPGLLADMEKEGVSPGPGITLVADPGLGMGGCVIESREGTLDARLEVQLEGLRRTLLQARRAADHGGAA
jgi:flagellar biosynthesis/type III secretory pathway protein FliH